MSSDHAAPDPRRWRALALLCGAFFMVILDAAIVVVALPSIEQDLGFSTHDLQWVLSAYALTFGGLLLLGGRAADLLGRRRVFMVGLALLHAGVAAVRPRVVARRADRGAGDPGRRRRDPDADRAVDHRHDLRGGRRAQQGAGHLGLAGRDRRDGRLADRRAADRAQLGVDLPHQRADRRRRAVPRAATAAGEPRGGRAARLRPRRRAVGDGGPRPARVRHRRGSRQPAGAIRRPSACWPARPRCSPSSRPSSRARRRRSCRCASCVHGPSWAPTRRC